LTAAEKESLLSVVTRRQTRSLKNSTAEEFMGPSVSSTIAIVVVVVVVIVIIVVTHADSVGRRG